MAAANAPVASRLQSAGLSGASLSVFVGHDMNARRLLTLAGAAFAVVVAVALALSAYCECKQPVFNNASKLITALQTFSRDKAAHHQQLQAEISLQDLIGGGYLTTNDVAAFDGMDVTFFGQTSDGSPPPVLAVARLRTDEKLVTCLLQDGSVAGLTRSRYQEMLRDFGQQDGSMSGSLPVRSETNSTSTAAGSRRSP